MLPVNFRHFVIACALALLACTANATYILGNGIAHSLTQNTRGLPATNADGSVLADTYSYSNTDDPNGNTTAKGSQGYYFDQANRLLLIPGIARYSYDEIGRASCRERVCR